MSVRQQVYSRGIRYAKLYHLFKEYMHGSNRWQSWGTWSPQITLISSLTCKPITSRRTEFGRKNERVYLSMSKSVGFFLKKNASSNEPDNSITKTAYSTDAAEHSKYNEEIDEDRNCVPEQALTPFRCLAAIPPEGSMTTKILLGCPSLHRGSRDAEVGFELRTFWSVNSCSNHLSHLVSKKGSKRESFAKD
ncbi:hypothetical protein CSKR_113103 [Clonorchis sinensis]|uniref:Uncharacterized protein n=1 Tax=Clonorchis sinensis TaxID=79923 RepID=A0A3R7CLW2_CLOSI|nr:hypothetical protein CSKR_113103 [Clonorchis sinensis]